MPVIDPRAFVHPEAVVIGDVTIGPAVYVGPGAVLRGDFGRILLEPGCNVQETCVLHAFPDEDVIVGESGHVGHGSILHGCRIGENAMVGMNAVVMDRAVVGENAILGAMAFVKAGETIPPGTLAMGVPARVVRKLSPKEIAWKRRGTAIYQQLAIDARSKLVATQALTEVESGRRRVAAPSYDPLVLERLKFSEPL